MGVRKLRGRHVGGLATAPGLTLLMIACRMSSLSTTAAVRVMGSAT